MRKVKSGDPLKIPAATFNTFIDAARDYPARRVYQGQGSQVASRHSGLVMVKNTSGSDRQRFGVLGMRRADLSAKDPEQVRNAFRLTYRSGLTAAKALGHGRITEEVWWTKRRQIRGVG